MQGIRLLAFPNDIFKASSNIDEVVVVIVIVKKCQLDGISEG